MGPQRSLIANHPVNRKMPTNAHVSSTLLLTTPIVVMATWIQMTRLYVAPANRLFLADRCR